MPSDAHTVLRDVVWAPSDACARLQATLQVLPGHPVLAGHFPGGPLVPGVLLLGAVCTACERGALRALAIREIEDARFYQPVLPGDVVALTASATDRDGELAVDGEWHGDGGRIASFRLRLVPRP